MRKPDCHDAEQRMTPEQGEGYLRLQVLLHRYYEGELTGGGKWFHDWDLKGRLLGAIARYCDQVNGWVEPPPRPAPLVQEEIF